MERRKRRSQDASPAGRTRAKHLLSGLIKCSCRGANYVISGKDYYRCAGQKERGTCGNTVSVRKVPLETAALSVLQDRLLTDEHAKLFVEEFRRESARLARADERRDEAAEGRLRQLEAEFANLYQNLLAGLASPALRTMIEEREAEKTGLEAGLQPLTGQRPSTRILPTRSCSTSSRARSRRCGRRLTTTRYAPKARRYWRR